MTLILPFCFPSLSPTGPSVRTFISHLPNAALLRWFPLLPYLQHKPSWPPRHASAMILYPQQGCHLFYLPVASPPEFVTFALLQREQHVFWDEHRILNPRCGFESQSQDFEGGYIRSLSLHFFTVK